MSRYTTMSSAAAKIVLCWVLALVCETYSTAAVLALHENAIDPETQGWIKIDAGGGGHIFAPVFSDLDTTDAWKVDTKTGGRFGDGKYRYLLTPQQVDQAIDRGWRLRTRARLIDVDSPNGSVVVFRTDDNTYGLSFGTAANGDPIVSMGSLGQVTVTGGAGAYHDYELNDADADGSVDLVIDGEVALTGIPGSGGSLGPMVMFGDFLQSSELNGNINYATVVLESLEITCDFTGNESCNIEDIDELIMEIAAGTNDPTYDLDGDDLVDVADRDEWLAQAGALNLDSGNPYLVADFDLDGTVDGRDFIIWNANKFSTSPTGKWSLGDANGDGVTDGRDFIAWNQNKFMPADGMAAVPEPAAPTLLLTLVISLGVVRRRP